MRSLSLFIPGRTCWLAALLLVFAFFACPPAHAQQTIMLDDRNGYWLGRDLELLEDREGRFSIEEIAAGRYDQQFFRSTQKVPNFSYTPSVYWARLIIDPSTTSHRGWLIEIENPLI